MNDLEKGLAGIAAFGWLSFLGAEIQRRIEINGWDDLVKKIGKERDYWWSQWRMECEANGRAREQAKAVPRE